MSNCIQHCYRRDNLMAFYASDPRTTHQIRAQQTQKRLIDNKARSRYKPKSMKERDAALTLQASQLGARLPKHIRESLGYTS
jgi:hypothetical protein